MIMRWQAPSYNDLIKLMESRGESQIETLHIAGNIFLEVANQ